MDSDVRSLSSQEENKRYGRARISLQQGRRVFRGYCAGIAPVVVLALLAGCEGAAPRQKSSEPSLIDFSQARRARPHYPKVPSVGIHTRPLSYDSAHSLGLATDRGIEIDKIESSGAGAAAGLKVGDILVSVDGQPIVGSHFIVRFLAEKKTGTSVTFRVLRNGGGDHQTYLDIAVRLGPEAQSS